MVQSDKEEEAIMTKANYRVVYVMRRRSISEEDRAENDDPDCETLSQCITVALGYERDQLTEARAEVERLRAELATANHWRDRHAKDSEAYAAQSQTNWTRAESAEREREEMRVALQFYAEGKCRCGVEYQAGERARAALKGGK